MPRTATPIRLHHRHAAALCLLLAALHGTAGCTQQPRRGTPGAQAAAAASTPPPGTPAPSAPAAPSAQIVPGNTAIVGPAGTPAPSAPASANTSASSSPPITNPRELFEKWQAIVAKLRSGERTPQTLTADERQTLIQIEALLQQQGQRRD